MNLTAEVVGKSADRFRAYGPVKLLRKPNGADHIKRHDKGLEPFQPGDRIRYDGNNVVLEGEVSGDTVTIDPKGVTINKVIFYKGPLETEAIAGSVEVSGSGKMTIELVEPSAPAAGVARKPIVVDE